MKNTLLICVATAFLNACNVKTNSPHSLDVASYAKKKSLPPSDEDLSTPNIPALMDLAVAQYTQQQMLELENLAKSVVAETEELQQLNKKLKEQRAILHNERFWENVSDVQLSAGFFSAFLGAAALVT